MQQQQQQPAERGGGELELSANEKVKERENDFHLKYEKSWSKNFPLSNFQTFFSFLVTLMIKSAKRLFVLIMLSLACLCLI